MTATGGEPVFVTLAEEERASHAAKYERWLETLRRQAADASDSETQANALALLEERRTQ